MDDFLEQTAIKRQRSASTALYFLCWTAMVLAGMIAVYGLSHIVGINPETGGISIGWQFLIIAAVFGGVAYLLWRVKDNCRVEYDYSFTNGTLDISRILNSRRRKYLCEMNMAEVVRCGPAQGPAFERTLREPEIKRHNWFVNRDARLYYFYFAKKGAKHCAVLELNDDMVALIRSRNYLPRDAWYDADGKQDYGRSLSR